MSDVDPALEPFATSLSVTQDRICSVQQCKVGPSSVGLDGVAAETMRTLGDMGDINPPCWTDGQHGIVQFDTRQPRQ
jgi:hypothetical protein